MLDTVFNGGDIKISMPAKGIFHIRTSNNGKFGEPLLTKYGILDNSDNTELYTTSSADGVSTVTDGKYTMSAKDVLDTITFAGSKRPLELEIKDNEYGFEIRIPITESERLFGLGDESRDSIMKRGKKAVMWIANVVSYGCIPFLLSSEGWGILVNCTFKHSYDLGKDKSDEILIESKKGEVDFYIFLADSMKEIIGCKQRPNDRFGPFKSLPLLPQRRYPL